MNVNKVTLIGNATNDPDMRKTPNGYPVATFSLATNYYWKDATSGEKKKSTEFHTIVAWQKLAEIVSKHIKKGDKLYIDGRLQTKSWQDTKGAKHKKTEIVAGSIIMLGSAKSKDIDDGKQLVVEKDVSVEEVGF